MPCECKSYNHDGDGSTDVVLNLPDWMASDRQNRTVCIDACIVHVIKELWKHEIPTLGCCCGHNKRNPNVIVDSGVSFADVMDVIKVVDGREWDVLQWNLIKLNTGEIYR